MDENKKAVLEAATMAGHILLESGAEIFRVEETIDRIAKAYGIVSASTFVLSSGIFTTAGGGAEDYFAKVQYIPLSSTRLDKVTMVNQLSREIEQNTLPLDEVKRRLQDIQNLPVRPPLTRILASGMGSGCFCYLFGGSSLDSLGAFIAGSLLYCFIIYFSSRYLSKIAGNISGGALVTIIAMMLFHMFPGLSLDQMVIGSIVPLLPGVSLPMPSGILPMAITCQARSGCWMPCSLPFALR